MADVVPLALGEIEDYARVDVSVSPGYAVAPAVIADLVLLLAELMENATALSPPYTRVTVSMADTASGVRISVVDHGIGLSEERIAEENNRISRRERLDLVPTEVLGLFVVGRLARRHGLRVWLAPTPGGGITATVDIGRHLLVSGPGTALGANAPTSSSLAEDRQLPSRPHAGAAAGLPPNDKAVAWAAAVVGQLTGVNVDAIDRASRTLSTGSSWNAFAPPRESEAPAGPQGEATSPLASVNDDRPAATTQGGIQRRVPGAQLPVGVSPQPPASALETVAVATSPSVQPTPAPAAAMTPQRPSVPAAPLVRRRVPGATLDPSPPRQQSPSGAELGWQAPPDPEAARALIEQFENGVLRARRDIEPEYRDNEGSGL
jgi:hypothetical protein